MSAQESIGLRASEVARTDVRERFAELLQQHRKIVFKVANTFAFSVEDRADLAQEIAAQLWRSFPRYDAARPFATWMYRVALNVGISSLRSRSAAAPLVALGVQHETIPAPEGASLEEAERLRGLERAIARLGGMNRALLLLYLEERSYAEIGEILGISETNVGTKLARLRRRMREELGAEEEG